MQKSISESRKAVALDTSMLAFLKGLDGAIHSLTPKKPTAKRAVKKGKPPLSRQSSSSSGRSSKTGLTDDMEDAAVEEDEEDEEVEEQPVKIKRARRVAQKKETNAEEVD